jgi:hypothetical protein
MLLAASYKLQKENLKQAVKFFGREACSLKLVADNNKLLASDSIRNTHDSRRFTWYVFLPPVS